MWSPRLSGTTTCGKGGAGGRSGRGGARRSGSRPRPAVRPAPHLLDLAVGREPVEEVLEEVLELLELDLGVERHGQAVRAHRLRERGVHPDVRKQHGWRVRGALVEPAALVPVPARPRAEPERAVHAVLLRPVETGQVPGHGASLSCDAGGARGRRVTGARQGRATAARDVRGARCGAGVRRAARAPSGRGEGGGGSGRERRFGPPEMRYSESRGRHDVRKSRSPDIGRQGARGAAGREEKGGGQQPRAGSGPPGATWPANREIWRPL